MQNDRCPEILFSGHQNTENEHNETLNKKARTDDSRKVWIRHICTIERFF
jgi:hypothetical protein